MKITCFEDFCLVVFVLVDDFWKTVANQFSRPGPSPLCSDSELIAMCLIAECRGWDAETTTLSAFKDYTHLFPHLPDQSRFNRRRRQLMDAMDLLREHLLKTIDLAWDKQCVIDSMPLPVVKFHRVPQSTGDWDEHEAAFGVIASKKQTIYGYKLHLLCTQSGLILDFALTGANVHDRNVAEDLLSAHPGIEVLGDKAYISQMLAESLKQHQEIDLKTQPRKNQKVQMPEWVKRLINSARQIIETVNSQLVGQFNVQTNKAHTFWGLCARLKTKLTARTLCLWIKRTFKMENHLQIKELAFPN